MSGPYSFGSNGAYDPVTFAQRLRDKIAGSPIAGQAPAWGAQFGIKTGSPDEWTRFFTMVGQRESGHRIAPTNPDGSLRRFSTTIPTERSFGPFQFNRGEYGLNTWQDVNDPDKVADALIRVAHQGKVPAYFGSVQRPRETLQHASWYDKNIAPRLNSQFDLEGAAFNSATQPLAAYSPTVPGGTQPPVAAPSQPAGPMPMADPQDDNPLNSFIARFQSPLTQQGLGILMSAMQGGDLNAGATAGAQRGNMALQQLLQQRKMQQEEMRRRALQQAVSGSDIFKGMSPGERAYLAADPEAAQHLMLAQYKRRMDPTADLQAERLRMEIDEARQMNPLKREKLATDIELARTKGQEDQKRIDALKRIGIEPDSAEGIAFRANGKLPAAAYEKLEQDQRKLRSAPKITEGLNNLLKMTDKYDDPSFVNAVGPLQGATPDQTGLLTAPFANIARLYGEIANKFEGGKSTPNEVRNDIMGSTEALAAAIKPLIRGPGEGVWTDADQARLVAIVGDLAQASSKEEFKRRLNAVSGRIESNFGLGIKFDAFGNRDPAQSPASAARPSGPVRVKSPDEARKLPSGTRILLPDGSEGVVP